MSLSPSTFGQPVQAVPHGPEPEVTTSSRRTVVIAAAAGAVALGVLGGAAFLVLGGEPELQASVTPPAQVPSVAPSAPAPVSTPLPTAAVLGRNVFVPVVRDAADVAAEKAEAKAAAEAAAAAEAQEAAERSAAEERTANTVAAATDSSASARIRELETQIAELTLQLDQSGDDEILTEQVAVLRREYAALLARNDELLDERDEIAADLRGLRIVELLSVDTTTPAGTLDLEVNDAPWKLDLDPGTTEVPDSLLLGTSSAGSEVMLRYVSVDGEDAPPTLAFQVGSSLYRVSVGGALTFTIL